MYRAIGTGIMTAGLFGVFYSLFVTSSVALLFGGVGLAVVGAIISGIVR